MWKTNNDLELLKVPIISSKCQSILKQIVLLYSLIHVRVYINEILSSNSDCSASMVRFTDLSAGTGLETANLLL